MKAPVIFANEVATGLFGHLVGAIAGGAVYRKSTFLLDSLGKQILPEWLTIEEHPHLLKGWRLRRSTAKACVRSAGTL